MDILHKEKIGVVHFHHGVWMNKLLFYKDELKIFHKLLKEIASNNNGQDVHIDIELFQNKFIIQRNEIDRIEHLIKENDDEAVKSGKLHIRRIDYEATNQYLDIENEMIQLEKLHGRLKDNFYDFMRKWM